MLEDFLNINDFFILKLYSPSYYQSFKKQNMNPKGDFNGGVYATSINHRTKIFFFDFTRLDNINKQTLIW